MFWKTGTIYRQHADAGNGAPSGDEPATPANTIGDEPVSPPTPDPPAEEPTQPAPEEGQPEEKVVDPAVRADKEELFQTKYQSLLALAEAKAPEVAQEFKGEPVTPKAPEDDPETRTLGEMTPSELTVALAKANEASIKKAIGEARTEDRIAQEQAHAHNTLRGIQQDLGLDAKTLGNGKITAESNKQADKVWKDAMDAAGQFGIDLEVVGGYGKFGMAMAQQLRLAAFSGGQSQQVTQATEDAARKAREALATQQPPKGAVPAQEAKTKEKKAIERMQEAQPADPRGLLDSSQKTA